LHRQGTAHHHRRRCTVTIRALVASMSVTGTPIMGADLLKPIPLKLGSAPLRHKRAIGKRVMAGHVAITFFPSSPLKNLESSAFSVPLSSSSWGDRVVVSAVG
jgi:hypothetical protein